MARIQRQMQMLIDHLATIGVEPLLDAKFRSNIAVNFRLPAGMPYSSSPPRMEEPASSASTASRVTRRTSSSSPSAT